MVLSTQKPATEIGARHVRMSQLCALESMQIEIWGTIG